MKGVTVTFDLEAIVTQIDRVPNHRSPAASERFKRWLRTAAGCVLTIGGDRPDRYVVLDATFLMTLLRPSGPDLAHNIVVHELAHVVFARYRSNREWRDLFDTPRLAWQHRAWLNLAYPIWDEYAACRLSAWAGDYAGALFNFQNCIARDIADFPAPSRRTRRIRWDVPAAAPDFIRRVSVATKPLLTAAYLTGHLDGMGIAEGVTHFSTPARTSVLAGCFEPLRIALRTIWEDGRHWRDGKSAMEPLVSVMQEVLRIWEDETEQRQPRSKQSRKAGGRATAP